MKQPRWLEREYLRLMQLKARGLGWQDIADALPGRTVSACQQAHAYRLAKLAAERAAVEIAHRPAIGPRIHQAPPSKLGGRPVPTSVLVVDAEIRARIAVQGLTAGLLGDPPAGRSALDQSRAGGATEPGWPADRRTVHQPRAPITLATGPLR